MKNIIVILFTVILLNLKGYAQQIVKINNRATLSLPSNSKSATRLEANNFVTSHLNGDKLTAKFVSERKPENMYIVGNVMVTLYPQNAHTTKQHLLDLKKGFEAMQRGNNTYNSELKSFYGFTVLITNYITRDHIETLNFFVCNDMDANDITGSLEFNSKDVAEAKQVLDNILANLKFKAQ